jgi:hypothetical protein
MTEQKKQRGRPKGTIKNAHPLGIGRPREYDGDKIFADLIKWAKKEDATNFLGFCGEYGIPSKVLLKYSTFPEYRELYNIAKDLIGMRREINLSKGKLHPIAYSRNVYAYDVFSRDTQEEMNKEEIKYAHELKKETDENVSEKIVEQFEGLMNQIDKLQKK